MATAREHETTAAALRAFFQYVAISEPALSLHCQRVLAIPSKRYQRGPLEFLTEEEAAPWWQRPILAPGSEEGIGRFYSSRFRRASVIAKSRRFAAKT